MRKRDRYGALVNRAMAEKLVAGDAVNVSECSRLGRWYVLPCEPDLEKDYCDAHKELWIWSIGRRRIDGAIHASTSADLYQNPEYECLWLR